MDEKKISDMDINEMFEELIDTIKNLISSGQDLEACSFFLHEGEGLSEPQRFLFKTDGSKGPNIMNAFYALGWEAKDWEAHRAVVFLRMMVKMFRHDQAEFVKNNLETCSPETYPEDMRDEGLMVHMFDFKDENHKTLMFTFEKDEKGVVTFSEQKIKHEDMLGTTEKFTEAVMRGYKEFNREEHDHALFRSECERCATANFEVPGLMEFGNKLNSYKDEVTGIFDMKKIVDDLSETILKGFSESGELCNIAFIGHREKSITPPVFLPKSHVIPMEHLIRACGSICVGSEGDEIILFIHCVGVHIDDNVEVDESKGVEQFPDGMRQDGVLEVRYFVEDDNAELKYHIYTKKAKGLEFTETVEGPELRMANIVELLKKGMANHGRIQSLIAELNSNASFPTEPDPDDHLKDINPEDLIK